MATVGPLPEAWAQKRGHEGWRGGMGCGRGWGEESITSTWEARTGWARIMVQLLGQMGTHLGRRRCLLLS